MVNLQEHDLKYLSDFRRGTEKLIKENRNSKNERPPSQQPRKILTTIALPYANGPLHIGHIFESVQTDIWVRSLRMAGHEVHFVCGDDTHGTPILLKARELGKEPEQLIQEMNIDHKTDFASFNISFSHYSSTHSEENRELCEYFYQKMIEKKVLSRKSIEQLYCPNDKMFLPDRFVKGTCPNCASVKQNGDSCDVCGATYNPTELKEAQCAICGTAPTKAKTEHIFFELNQYKDFLSGWLKGHTSEETSKKMHEWFTEDLRSWDISRDDPYFGFAIPGEVKKYFYVWVDAPMGYVSGTKQLAKLKGIDFDQIWRDDKTYELHHFIGKDITYFHTLFWPALLKTADFRLPSFVHVHGFVSINGEKMSKSKGNFVMGKTIAKHMDTEYLRFYFASKMNSSRDDLDFSTADLAQKVNSEWIGKITNLASRGAQMLIKNFAGQVVSMETAGAELWKNVSQKLQTLPDLYDRLEYSKAMALIRDVADEANRYFDERAPWKLIKEDPEETQKILSSTLNIFRLLAIALAPIVPKYSARAQKLLREENVVWTWQNLNAPVTHFQLLTFEPLAIRVEDSVLQAIMEETKLLNEVQPAVSNTAVGKPANAVAKAPSAKTPAAETPPGEIEMEDFLKVDLRVAKVLQAEAVAEADKLLRLKVEVGGVEKQIFAGIKKHYDPATLVGKQVVIVNNLKPRKMKFGMSEGMVLAVEGEADSGGEKLFVIVPTGLALVGGRVK